MKRLLLIGGGGHCRSCVDVIETTGAFQIAGVVERLGGPLEPVLGYPVIGSDSDLSDLLGWSSTALIAVGQVKSYKPRMKLFDMVRNLGGSLAVVRSPHAYVSNHAHVGEGSIVMHGASVNAGSRVGINCIINSRALVEHDVLIGAHSHISTGAVINGGVQIGEGTFVGSGTVINQGIKVGGSCVIASGSIIRGDVPPGTQVVGLWR